MCAQRPSKHDTLRKTCELKLLLWITVPVFILYLAGIACRAPCPGQSVQPPMNEAASKQHGLPRCQRPADYETIERIMIKIANELRVARDDVPQWAISVEDLVTQGRIDRSQATLGADGIVYHADYGPVPKRGLTRSSPPPRGLYHARHRSVLWVDADALGGRFTCVYTGHGEIEWITVDEFGRRKARYEAEFLAGLEDLGGGGDTRP